MDLTISLSSPFTWLIVAVSSSYVFYRYLTSSFTFFSDQGIPGPKPIPIFGNIWGIWKQNMPIVDKELIKRYGKVVGTFDGSLPNLWTTDTDIIKAVFVKDFDHFINRRPLAINTKVLRKFLPFLRDNEWKDVRSSVTPAFTSGKIKRMSVMIKECADRLVLKFDPIARNEGKIYAKAQFSAFTMDVIARCVFGIALENLGETDDVFMRNAKAAFNPPTQKSPLALVLILFPNILNLVGEKAFTFDEFTFFLDIMQKMIKDRQDSKQQYNDFVEAATESISAYTKEVNGKTVPMWEKEEVDEIIAAESIIFLLAGFDTTASTLTHTIFQLAKCPDVQEKLYQEIQNRLEQFDQVSHEMVMDFHYMEQVIQEVMRLYPTFPRVERECNKDITIKNVRFIKGMMVTIPSYALHHDPDYFPDPLTFNPDRWSPENKSKMNSYAYMPFGMGPRNCVGMRFAMEEIKIALCTILNQYRFFAVEETPEEITFEDGLLQIVQPVETTVGIELRHN